MYVMGGVQWEILDQGIVKWGKNFAIRWLWKGCF